MYISISNKHADIEVSTNKKIEIFRITLSNFHSQIQYDTFVRNAFSKFRYYSVKNLRKTGERERERQRDTKITVAILSKLVIRNRL